MTRTGFHPAAWLAWLGATVLVVLTLDNPFASVALLASLGVLASGFRVDGPEGRVFRLMLRVGLIVIVARVVLFGLTGHTGATTLVVLPELALPSWLGGFVLGGRVTGEVLALEVAEGLEIAALLAAFGVFLSVVRTHEIIRLLPRFLADAGVVVGIALAFVPTLLRTATEVRDAQRMRGPRFRGFRSARALVVPVLAGALERSLALAASMEARGFGRHDAGGYRARAGAVASLLALTVGGALVLFRTAAGPGFALLVVSGAALAWCLRRLGTGPRTRYRSARVEGIDVVMIVASACTGVLTLAARALAGAQWYPYPIASWPPIDLRLVALALAVAAPAAIDALHVARLRRASARNEDALRDPVEVAS